jgi:hypothetical protein
MPQTLGRPFMARTMVEAGHRVKVPVFQRFAGPRRTRRSSLIYADDYGVDRCLSSSAPCGTAVANSYCHSHEYEQALSFRKVDRDAIAGATPTRGPGSCQGRQCDEYVAIECAR